MKIFFDTEFHDNGKTIELISIGAIREDGTEYYAESSEYDRSKATPWLRDNVISKLKGNGVPRSIIADTFLGFAGRHPEFWGYYADYDWIVLSQLYGPLLNRPSGWPMLCLDIKQLAISLGDPKLPNMSNPAEEHNALADAKWARAAYMRLQAL